MDATTPPESAGVHSNVSPIAFSAPEGGEQALSPKKVSFDANASNDGSPKAQRYRRGSLHVSALGSPQPLPTSPASSSPCDEKPEDPAVDSPLNLDKSPKASHNRPKGVSSTGWEDLKHAKNVLEYGHGGVYHQKVKPNPTARHKDKPIQTHAPGAPLITHGSDLFNQRFETTNEKFNREMRLAQARERRRTVSRGSSRGSSRGGSRGHSPNPENPASPSKDKEGMPSSPCGDYGSKVPVRSSGILCASGLSSLRNHGASPPEEHIVQPVHRNPGLGRAILQERAQRIVAGLIEASVQSLKEKSGGEKNI